MPGIDFEAKDMGSLRSGHKTINLELPIIFSPECLGECTGVELNKLAAGPRSGLYLRKIRSNEETDFDAVFIHPATGICDRHQVRGYIESAFGGNFLARFGHQANDVGFQLERDLGDR